MEWVACASERQYSVSKETNDEGGKAGGWGPRCVDVYCMCMWVCPSVRDHEEGGGVRSYHSRFVQKIGTDDVLTHARAEMCNDGRKETRSFVRASMLCYEAPFSPIPAT